MKLYSSIFKIHKSYKFVASGGHLRRSAGYLEPKFTKANKLSYPLFFNWINSSCISIDSSTFQLSGKLNFNSIALVVWPLEGRKWHHLHVSDCVFPQLLQQKSPADSIGFTPECHQNVLLTLLYEKNCVNVCDERRKRSFWRLQKHTSH